MDSSRMARRPHVLLYWCCCALILLYPAFAHAEVQMYVDDVSPYFYRESGVEKGVFYEVLKDLSARVGHVGTISELPLARELEIVRRTPTALGIIARMPEREDSYTWIFKILDEKTVLITSSGSKIDISSASSAQHLRVGVLRGSPSESAARKLGFTNIFPVSHSEENARKLAVGRIDAWIAVWPVAASAQKQAGLDLSTLRQGAVLPSFGFYLAASRQLDPREAEKWKSTFNEMLADGSYARILHNHNYMVPALCGQRQHCVSAASPRRINLH